MRPNRTKELSAALFSCSYTQMRPVSRMRLGSGQTVRLSTVGMFFQKFYIKFNKLILSVISVYVCMGEISGWCAAGTLEPLPYTGASKPPPPPPSLPLFYSNVHQHLSKGLKCLDVNSIKSSGDYLDPIFYQLIISSSALRQAIYLSVSLCTGESASWLVEIRGQLYFSVFHWLKLHLRNLFYYASGTYRTSPLPPPPHPLPPLKNPGGARDFNSPHFLFI